MTTYYYKVNGDFYSASIKLVGDDLCDMHRKRRT